MFAFLATASSLLSLVALALSGPAEDTASSSKLTSALEAAPDLNTHPHASTCLHGELQCCQFYQHANDTTASIVLDFLRLRAPASTHVGIFCTPMTVLGMVTRSGCYYNPMCCEGTGYGGFISMDCNLVSL